MLSAQSTTKDYIRADSKTLNCSLICQNSNDTYRRVNYLFNTCQTSRTAFCARACLGHLCTRYTESGFRRIRTCRENDLFFFKKNFRDVALKQGCTASMCVWAYMNTRAHPRVCGCDLHTARQMAIMDVCNKTHTSLLSYQGKARDVYQGYANAGKNCQAMSSGPVPWKSFQAIFVACQIKHIHTKLNKVSYK